MEYLRDHADYLAIHLYVGNPANNFGDFMTSSLDLDERIKVTEGVIDGALAGQTPRRKLYIAWDEWNIWYRARGASQRGRRIPEERYNLEDALVVATLLNGTMVLNMVNRHQTQAIETEVELQDKQFSGAVSVSEVNGPDIKAENDFEKTNVKTVERSATAEGRKLRCSFPPDSYTMIKGNLA